MVTKAAEVARALGVKTADHLEDHATRRATWSFEKELVFKTAAPAALSLIATDGPVSVTIWKQDGAIKRIGHNRGVWPAKIAKSVSWKDNITPAHDKNPFFFLGMQFRLWSPSAEHRDRLASSTVDLIARRSEQDGSGDELLHGFQDLGADLDLTLFELEVRDVAERLGARVWNDDELEDWLDRHVLKATALGRKEGKAISAKLIHRVLAY